MTNSVTRAQNELKGIVLSTTDALDFANEIYQIVGNATFFDWRQAAGTTFGTQVHVQDYSNVPSDFAALKKDDCYVQDDSVATNFMYPLQVYESLQQSTQPYGMPRQISVENGSFRLSPVPDSTRGGGGQWAIKFSYFKRPKRLINVSDTFEFDDIWFDTFCKGMTARAASFTEDDRAGRWAGRNRTTALFEGTGMWGEFAANLNNMVEQEQLASGPMVYGPSEALAR